MTEKPADTSGASKSALPKASDLGAVERQLRKSVRKDLTEAKEAIVEALLQLTVHRCSGEGPEGEFIYGTKPSLRLVSGFLLPRFDDTGQEDETTDIRIATMGVDLQVAANTSGEVVVRPEMAIYARALPTWEEIYDPRHDMVPQVLLSRETRMQLEALARQYINEEKVKLPPEERAEEPDERPGEAAADADGKREAADAAQQLAAERGAEDKDALGQAKAAAVLADKAEQVAAARKKATAERLTARREKNAAVAAIRRAAFDRASRELGIRLRPAEPGADRALTAEDLAERPQGETEQDAAEGSNAGGQQPEADALATGAAAEIRAGAGVLDDRHAAPQGIPQKWKRFQLNLGEFRFDYGDASSLQRAREAFEERVMEQARLTLAGWIASDEGQRDAYRRGEHILPSQFKNKESWQRFLEALRTRRPAVIDDVLPKLNGLSLVLEADGDYVDDERINLRVAIENGADSPGDRSFFDFEPSVFQVALEVSLAADLHKPLRLDRVQPSYRFRDWLTYPAMGLNCGVHEAAAQSGIFAVCTTWAPRYQQPRIEPRTIAGVPTSYKELADPACDIRRLFALPDAYDAWIEKQTQEDAGYGLPQESADKERQAHRDDIESYRRESGYIRTGIQLLLDSREASKGNSGKTSESARKTIPYQAWLRANEAFALYGGEKFTDWRLFQLAFILAHVATFASRMPEFSDRFDPFRDEESASLLYFATGGGKSEAFFGLLVFNLYLDRLRGKHRGVTALVRYPLRLLTLQQARRLMRVLVNAELVRLRKRIPGAPFEIGFWVGSGNTPNRAAQGFGGVPLVTAAGHEDDTALLQPPQGDSDAARAARRRSDRYKEALEAYDKLRVCPCCNEPTGMRRYSSQAGRVGIVCFNAGCDWNKENPPAPHRVPLPIILTDDTIYQRAPAVVLGTIDKLALIGQHDRTINLIAGMFGVARYVDPDNQHFHVPRGERSLDLAEDNGWRRLWPAFGDGAKLFHDPFPSLVIQDEGHLLEESLGTFSGLFETTFESILTRLGSGILRGHLPTWRSAAGEERPRLAKVIAATATISDPDRQLRVLYQREPLRFPCPGPNLYESFYAEPQRSIDEARRAIADRFPPHLRAEQAGPRMRSYVSLMTNGRSHTMTTSGVVSAYHLVITRLWRAIVEEGRCRDAVAAMVAVLRPSDVLTPLRRKALEDLVPDGADVLATLLDLQRISLTYVTNKKGGDQIIETLQTQVERDQRADGIEDLRFETELISGGVTISEIQDVMRRAEAGVKPGSPFPSLGESLRNIVATSAISHGVDVDKFNAMFFAGLPSDIAEYIQASSRVGRSHVGFSLLVPTPHSRRDRYVVETHDQFHRFLERMIPPPAVQRWAERAIRRIIPSVLQAYLCGVVEQELFAAAGDGEKGKARTFTTAAAVKAWADRHAGGNPGAITAVTQFTLEAIGLYGRGDRGTGAANHTGHYRQFAEDRVRELLDRFLYRSEGSKLSNFWQSIQSAELRKPMTSLRDVDAGGVIMGATRDPWRGRNVHLETTRQIMGVIRGQRMAVRGEVDADASPIDVED